VVAFGTMNQNTKSYLLLVLTIASLAYSPIAQNFTTAGLPGIAKYVVLVGGIAGALGLAYSQAITGTAVAGFMVRLGFGTKKTG
jgi:hypothetical protein